MAAYAALVSLINNIHQINKHPRLSTSLDNTHIQPLLHKAGLLLHFIESNNYGGGSKEAEDLERSIASAAHAAEDAIEFHIVDQIHAVTRETSLMCSLDLRQKIQDMDDVMKKANELKEKQGAGEEQTSALVERPVVEIGHTSAMVGLDAELEQLLHKLTGHQSSRHTISIVGMGGTGKTTLAQNIFQHPLIKEHFHCRAWATISQQHNARKVLSQVLSGIGKSCNGSVSNLGLELHQNLTGRRYLIILDDIWSVQAWNEVKRFFPDNKNGSRVVLTTRLSNVAKECVSSLILVINLLGEDKSWELFCEKAFKNEPCPPDLREVGEEIVKLCKGLALSIVVMGGLLLNSPRTIEHWKCVVRDIKLIPKQESLDALSLSYTHLPPHLKPCFLYMGMFEEDSDIRVSNVVRLWVAEGFIKPDESRVLEEIAEGYLNDMIDRNLILVGRRRKNGKIKSCGIHDLLRDLCIKVSEQQQFFSEISCSSDIRRTERRLVSRSLAYDYVTGHVPLARSIITYNSDFEIIPDKNNLLRVWSQGDSYSAAELYERVNLRYLAYQQLSYSVILLMLPTSVSLIWNLQTLIIRGWSNSLVVAPVEIWKMRQLRHVECRKIYFPWSNTKQELLILDNLQTLKTAVNLKLSDEVCKIIPNITKLHLYYDRELYGYDDCLIRLLCNLGQLNKLESLDLRIDLYTGQEKILRFPSSLNKLSLRNCALHWEELALIGSLPHLEVLFLELINGREWSPVSGEFCHLKFLKIDRAYELEDWNADSSHFPLLQQLFLKNCGSLKEIPLDIGEIPTLQLICVDIGCSISAAVSAVQIKEEQLENLGNDVALEVQLRMYNSKVASLKEVVSINNIRLFEV